MNTINNYSETIKPTNTRAIKKDHINRMSFSALTPSIKTKTTGVIQSMRKIKIPSELMR
jgi:hypothetical protein